MEEKEYDVALSFAGKDRHQAERLAKLLDAEGYSVFYDEFERAQLWGKNLYQHLSSVYKDQAHYCVIFLSKHYARKLWPQHELQSAQARAFKESKEYILPVRLDDTEIPGLLETIGYLDLREVCIEQVYKALVEKLQDRTFQSAVTNESAGIDSPNTTITRNGEITRSHQNEESDKFLNMHDRRDDLQIVTPQIFEQMEERAETTFRTSAPNLTVKVRPALPHRPIISTSDIYEFMKVEPSIPFNDWADEFGTKKVKGGVCFMGIPGSSIYWELNEHGIIYHRLA
ncbi:MAG: TIR domain-containing protein [Candidatus Poribacteria bacterium]|nr:TIR domain-containing protein [Candidatus Poribacteria bacterium]